MGNTFYFDWEPALMAWLQEHMGPVGEAIAKFVTLFGEEIFIVAILGFVYWSLDKQLGKKIGLNMVVVCVWNPMIKNIFIRRRPYFDCANVKCLKPVDASADLYDLNAQGYSFPSGHSANSGAVYGTIARYTKNSAVRIIGIVLMLLVGISRFCVGVHFPTDVLAGWALGILVIFLLPWLEKVLKKTWILYLILFVLALSGFFYCTSNDYYTGVGMMAGFFVGDLFEKKYVKFESTRNVLFMILRFVVGGALYFGLNTVLKMPFSKEFLENGTLLAHLVRTIRYAVVIFVICGLYPMLFKVVEKGKKKEEPAD